MSAELLLFGPVTADTTAETVFTNLTGTIAVLETVTVAQPSTAAATTLRLSLGTDGATTRGLEVAIPAGVFSQTYHLGWRITGTTILQLSSVMTDDVVVCTGNGYRVAS